MSTVGYLYATLDKLLKTNPENAKRPVVVKVYDADDDLLGEGILETAWSVHDSLPGEDEPQQIFEITAKGLPQPTLEDRLEFLRGQGYGELVDQITGDDDAVS